jgi:malate dehydrogenase
MGYLCQDKLVILGSAGAIGSNMVQAALTLGLTPHVTLYDPFEKGNQGAADEICHCAFPGARIEWTSDVEQALRGATYLISSGGAPRKEGMTREDLLRGNAEIAAQLGRDVRAYCPEARLLVVIFNPADITGLVAQVHSGLAPGRVCTLAALDSTRLQTELARHFKLPQDEIQGCRTYGGHGETMAVFASTARVAGRPLLELIGTPALSEPQWESIKDAVRQGGKRVIQLRGRSSFQSPAHHSVLMLKAAIDGRGYPWPSGVYVDDPRSGLRQIVMAMETTLDGDGARWDMPRGTEREMAELKASYEHLVRMRDEVIGMGLLPPLSEWSKVNPRLCAS